MRNWWDVHARFDSVVGCRETLTLAQPACSVPGSPRAVAATGGNGQVTVTWAEPESDGGNAITGYTVTASPGGMTASVGGGARSAVFSGLIDGTAYTFTVRARNGAGLGPESSPPASIGSPAPVLAGATFYSDGTSSRTGPTGARVSAFATSAEPGFEYRLVSGRTAAGTPGPCSADIVPVNATPRFANAQGVIAQTAGTLNRPAGQWQICFLAAGQTVTGATAYTVTG